jgi:hypothetical protein
MAMTLLDAVFEVHKSRGAFDPRNGRPVHSFYRYSGPVGPAYVGWTDDDQMTWVEGPNIGAASLDWGVGIPLSTLEERDALRRGVSMRIANQVIQVVAPDDEGVCLRLRGETNEWTLEGVRFGLFDRHLRWFNRRLWRGTASSGTLLGLLISGTGKRSFQAKVVEDIRSDEVSLLVFCWASLMQTLRYPGQLGSAYPYYYGPE